MRQAKRLYFDDPLSDCTQDVMNDVHEEFQRDAQDKYDEQQRLYSMWVKSEEYLTTKAQIEKDYTLAARNLQHELFEYGYEESEAYRYEKAPLATFIATQLTKLKIKCNCLNEHCYWYSDFGCYWEGMGVDYYRTTHMDVCQCLGRVLPAIAQYQQQIHIKNTMMTLKQICERSVAMMSALSRGVKAFKWVKQAIVDYRVNCKNIILPRDAFEKIEQLYHCLLYTSDAADD